MIKNIKTLDIRNSFLRYFEKHGHKIVESSSLVTKDPTLFFTNAGMVQFKDIFLGIKQCDYDKAASVQRCLRVSGKHNDLEVIGYTNRHHTFFEMLGNFSFGSYFKEEAIHYAWEFLTKELKINSKRLWITVHKNDKETEKFWQRELKITKTNAQGISYCEDKDNFWTMGDVGPCGYCSEIFYDHGNDFIGNPPGTGINTNSNDDRYVEIWNLVFMQFEKDHENNMVNLKKPSIDTGMGLERISAVMQGVNDNYQTDIFLNLQKILYNFIINDKTINESSLKSKAMRLALRIAVDHIRAAVFLISDGVYPSNEKTGYVLRSIIRRAVYHLYLASIKKPIFSHLVIPFLESLEKIYLNTKFNDVKYIKNIIENEEIKFLNTLDRGLVILNKELHKLKNNIIPGSIAFELHDTYGFPIALTMEISKRKNFIVNQSEFEIEMQKQRNSSRVNSTAKNSIMKIDCKNKSNFVGYDHKIYETNIYEIYNENNLSVSKLSLDEIGYIILNDTPFYAEAGGQIGDSGLIISNNGQFEVLNTKKIFDCYLHYGKVISGFIENKIKVIGKIDVNKRKSITANHSAVHLLNKALKLLVGKHTIQQGSYIDDKKLRFDFANTFPLSHDVITSIEQMVNEKIMSNARITTEIKNFDIAKKEEIEALFENKYEDIVRVVGIDHFSKEFCGGTHVNYTGEIGIFKIINETGVASGIRRIEATTGQNALILINKNEGELTKINSILNTNTKQVFDRVNQLIIKNKSLEKNFIQLQREYINIKGNELIENASNIKDLNIIMTSFQSKILSDIKILRELVIFLKQKLNSVFIYLIVQNENKMIIMSGVTKNYSKIIDASLLLKKIEGYDSCIKGGGTSELAYGIGNNIKNINNELDNVLFFVKNKLNFN